MRVIKTYSGVEQLEARLAHNQEVVGSNPISAIGVQSQSVHLKMRELSLLPSIRDGADERRSGIPTKR